MIGRPPSPIERLTAEADDRMRTGVAQRMRAEADRQAIERQGGTAA